MSNGFLYKTMSESDLSAMTEVSKDDINDHSVSQSMGEFAELNSSINDDITTVENAINVTEDLEQKTTQMATNIANVEGDNPTPEMQEIVQTENENLIEEVKENADSDQVPTLDKETVDNNPNVVKEELIEAKLVGERFAERFSGDSFLNLSKVYNIKNVRTESLSRKNSYSLYLQQFEGFMDTIKKAFIAIKNFILKCVHRFTRWMQELRLFFTNLEKDVKSLKELKGTLKGLKLHKVKDVAKLTELLPENSDLVWFFVDRDPMKVINYHFEKLKIIGTGKDLSSMLDLKQAKSLAKGGNFFKNLLGNVFPKLSKTNGIFIEKEILDIVDNTEELKKITSAIEETDGYNIIIPYAYFRRHKGSVCVMGVKDGGKKDMELGIQSRVVSVDLIHNTDFEKNIKDNKILAVIFNKTTNTLDVNKSIELIDMFIKAFEGYAFIFPELVKKAIAALEKFKNSNLEQTLDGKTAEEAKYYKLLMKLSNLSAIGISGIISGTYSQIAWALTAANKIKAAFNA